MSDSYCWFKAIANGNAPDPWDIRSARHATKFTMAEAAQMVYVSRSTWLSWEQGKTLMHPGLAELFALKAGLVELSDVPLPKYAHLEKGQVR